MIQINRKTTYNAVSDIIFYIIFSFKNTSYYFVHKLLYFLFTHLSLQFLKEVSLFVQTKSFRSQNFAYE